MCVFAKSVCCSYTDLTLSYTTSQQGAYFSQSQPRERDYLLVSLLQKCTTMSLCTFLRISNGSFKSEQESNVFETYSGLRPMMRHALQIQNSSFGKWLNSGMLIVRRNSRLHSVTIYSFVMFLTFYMQHHVDTSPCWIEPKMHLLWLVLLWWSVDALTITVHKSLTKVMGMIALHLR